MKRTFAIGNRRAGVARQQRKSASRLALLGGSCLIGAMLIRRSMQYLSRHHDWMSNNARRMEQIIMTLVGLTKEVYEAPRNLEEGLPRLLQQTVSYVMRFYGEGVSGAALVIPRPYNRNHLMCYTHVDLDPWHLDQVAGGYYVSSAYGDKQSIHRAVCEVYSEGNSRLVALSNLPGPYKALLAIPLRLNREEKPAGVLCLYSELPDSFVTDPDGSQASDLVRILSRLVSLCEVARV